jgi:serine/threonine protein kinase
MFASKKCKFLLSYKEVFEEGDYFFIVMEYCSGGDLQNKLDSGQKFTKNV